MGIGPEGEDERALGSLESGCTAGRALGATGRRRRHSARCTGRVHARWVHAWWVHARWVHARWVHARGVPTPGGSAPQGFTPDGFAPEGPDGRFGPGQFGAERFTDADLVGAPPKIWLIAALVLGLAAAAVALALGASVGYAFVAWLLAGPVAIGLLAIFTQSDVRQRSMPIYNAPSWLPALYWSAVAAAGLGVLSSAWSIAQWAGHQ